MAGACDLCHLPADVSEGSEGPGAAVQVGTHVLHVNCCQYASNSTLNLAPSRAGKDVNSRTRKQYVSALRQTASQKCAHCEESGAWIECRKAGCRRTYHLQCARDECIVDEGEHKVECRSHSDPGKEKKRQAEEAATSPSKRQRVQSASNAADEGIFQETPPEHRAKAVAEKGRGRRSGRLQGTKRPPPEDSETDEDEKRGPARAVAADEAEPSGGGEDMETDDDDETDTDDDVAFQLPKSKKKGGGRRGKLDDAQRNQPARKRKQVLNYDEELVILEEKEAAAREAQKEDEVDWTDQPCLYCHKRDNDEHLLLCDMCDRAAHTFCCRPPLDAVPEGDWFCPSCDLLRYCERCGHEFEDGEHVRCACGARLHGSCYPKGSALCQSCKDGKMRIDVILGCREEAVKPRGKVPGSVRLQFYVKWVGRSYRDCQWMLEAAARRLATFKVKSFERMHRYERNVRPELLAEWSKPERVVAVDNDSKKVYVKWQGLEYKDSTWEEASSVAPGLIKALKKRQACDISAPTGTGVRFKLPLKDAPAHFNPIGTLKDYQVEGVSWLLGKLRVGQSCILGDEMGLGKTIQTAVLLEMGWYEGTLKTPAIIVVPLSTIASWERELAKWAPSLHVVTYVGNADSRALIQRYELGGELDGEEAPTKGRRIPHFHILLTTAERITNGEARRPLMKFKWSALIIDEGHRLKGEQSLLARELRTLGATWNLVLTGTPLQNALKELFVLLAFLEGISPAQVEAQIRKLPDPAPPEPPTKPEAGAAKSIEDNVLEISDDEKGACGDGSKPEDAAAAKVKVEDRGDGEAADVGKEADEGPKEGEETGAGDKEGAGGGEAAKEDQEGEEAGAGDKEGEEGGEAAKEDREGPESGAGDKEGEEAGAVAKEGKEAGDSAKGDGEDGAAVKAKEGTALPVEADKSAAGVSDAAEEGKSMAIDAETSGPGSSNAAEDGKTLAVVAKESAAAADMAMVEAAAEEGKTLAVVAKESAAAATAKAEAEAAKAAAAEAAEAAAAEDTRSFMRRLLAYLEPRMLRRLKHHVSKELPPKITRKVYCRLSPLQRELYRNVLAKNHVAINIGLHTKQRQSLLNVLIALRKACNHPFMLPGQEPEHISEEEAAKLLVAASGKLTVLAQMLPRLIADGHRVLIFCQFKDMMDILEDFLYDLRDPSGRLAAHRAAQRALPARRRGRQKQAPAAAVATDNGAAPDDPEREDAIPFFRLDGNTKQQERQRMIDEYNAPNCRVPVFLMSTRAGGLGINVQSADTVIIFDPDFNPFADLQAEGRAHRMGQAATVMVYQLVTPGAVEEKIQELAQRKKRLEAIVTQHMGRAQPLSHEDVQKALLHGASNLMEESRGSAATAGQAEALSERELERLLDRTQLYETDEAFCINDLLGEVRAGVAAEAAEETRPVSPDPAEKRDAEVESRMMELLRQRAAELSALEAAEFGRGKREKARNISYRQKTPVLSDVDDSSDEEKDGGDAPAAAKEMGRGEGPSDGEADSAGADSSEEDNDDEEFYTSAAAKKRILQASKPPRVTASAPTLPPGASTPTMPPFPSTSGAPAGVSPASAGVTAGTLPQPAAQQGSTPNPAIVIHQGGAGHLPALAPRPTTLTEGQMNIAAYLERQKQQQQQQQQQQHIAAYLNNQQQIKQQQLLQHQQQQQLRQQQLGAGRGATPMGHGAHPLGGIFSHAFPPQHHNVPAGAAMRNLPNYATSPAQTPQPQPGTPNSTGHPSASPSHPVTLTHPGIFSYTSGAQRASQGGNAALPQGQAGTQAGAYAVGGPHPSPTTTASRAQQLVDQANSALRHSTLDYGVRTPTPPHASQLASGAYGLRLPGMTDTARGASTSQGPAEHAGAAGTAGASKGHPSSQPAGSEPPRTSLGQSSQENLQLMLAVHQLKYGGANPQASRSPGVGGAQSSQPLTLEAQHITQFDRQQLALSNTIKRCGPNRQPQGHKMTPQEVQNLHQQNVAEQQQKRLGLMPGVGQKGGAPPLAQILAAANGARTPGPQATSQQETWNTVSAAMSSGLQAAYFSAMGTAIGSTAGTATLQADNILKQGSQPLRSEYAPRSNKPREAHKEYLEQQRKLVMQIQQQELEQQQKLMRQQQSQQQQQSEQQQQVRRQQQSQQQQQSEQQQRVRMQQQLQQQQQAEQQQQVRRQQQHQQQQLQQFQQQQQRGAVLQGQAVGQHQVSGQPRQTAVHARAPANLQHGGHQMVQQQTGAMLGFPVPTPGPSGQPRVATPSRGTAQPRAAPGPRLREEFVIELPMPPKERCRRSLLDYRPALRTPPAPRAPGLPVAGRAAPTVIRTPPLPVAGVLYTSRLPAVGDVKAPSAHNVWDARHAHHSTVRAPPQPRTVLWPMSDGPVVTIPAPVGPLRKGGGARSPVLQPGALDPDAGKPLVKRCKRCKETKARIDFSRETQQPDGLSIWCRACWTIYRSERRREKKKMKAERSTGPSADPQADSAGNHSDAQVSPSTSTSPSIRQGYSGTLSGELVPIRALPNDSHSAAWAAPQPRMSTSPHAGPFSVAVGPHATPMPGFGQVTASQPLLQQVIPPALQLQGISVPGVPAPTTQGTQVVPAPGGTPDPMAGLPPAGTTSRVPPPEVTPHVPEDAAVPPPGEAGPTPHDSPSPKVYRREPSPAAQRNTGADAGGLGADSDDDDESGEDASCFMVQADKGRRPLGQASHEGPPAEVAQVTASPPAPMESGGEAVLPGVEQPEDVLKGKDSDQGDDLDAAPAAFPDRKTDSLAPAEPHVAEPHGTERGPGGEPSPSPQPMAGGEGAQPGSPPAGQLHSVCGTPISLSPNT